MAQALRARWAAGARSWTTCCARARRGGRRCARWCWTTAASGAAARACAAARTAPRSWRRTSWRCWCARPQTSLARRSGLPCVHCSTACGTPLLVCTFAAAVSCSIKGGFVHQGTCSHHGVCGGTEAPALGPGARGGPLAGRYDRHAAGGAGAGARGVADAGVRNRGRLAEPALLLARGQVWLAGDSLVLAVSSRVLGWAKATVVVPRISMSQHSIFRL